MTAMPAGAPALWPIIVLWGSFAILWLSTIGPPTLAIWPLRAIALILYLYAFGQLFP